MKPPALLVLGPITIRVLHRGDDFPCPSKGHPPFTHERDDPALVISRDEIILRIVPLSAVGNAPASVFRGRAGRKPWALSPAEILRVVRWASKNRSRKTHNVIPREAMPRPDIKVPEGQTGGRLRPRARTIPLASREQAGDCDYRHKLTPYERAFYDQFTRETVLNRWYDKDGVEALYPRGSEARRKLQFEYNRRQDDMLTHRDWFRHEPDPGRYEGEHSYTDGPYRMAGVEEQGATSPEDSIIEAIDRANEGW